MRAWPRASIRNLQRILWDIEKNVFSSRFDLLQLFWTHGKGGQCNFPKDYGDAGEEVCGSCEGGSAVRGGKDGSKEMNWMTVMRRMR